MHMLVKHKSPHRQIAAEREGRPLEPFEVVHHIDGNPKNNDPKNLVILPSQAEHRRIHGRQNRFARILAENEVKRPRFRDLFWVERARLRLLAQHLDLIAA